MDRQQILDLYRVMYMARQIDLAEQQLSSRGEAFFHVSGAGHEATAALAPHLTEHDWLHCHYRSRALLVARGLSPRAFFDNLLCKDTSSSHGRRMSPFFSDPRLHVLSMVTPVANNALQSVGVASAVKDRPGRPLVVCGVGDGTTQQGEFQEACAEANRRQVPVLFLIEDNQWAISTRTLQTTFFASPELRHFHGLPILRLDGRQVVDAYRQFGGLVSALRQDRRPRIAVVSVERLQSHTNADDQRIYRSETELAAALRTGDPIKNCADYLLADGAPPEELARIRSDVLEQVQAAERAALEGPEPQPEPTCKRAVPVELTHPAREYRGQGPPEFTMRDALREVLRHRLLSDGRVCLFGEDIEDPKGDVFGVTRGLSTEFPGRVCNSPLSESTILGVSIGQALAGLRPVAFVQFADFLPLAYNQIATELATMYWRTAGRWNAPVIVLAACGGYRPGLGPYHAQTGEATFAHTPGLDVFMPSTAVDAAGMLNAAFASQRPTLLLYPKASLNDPQDKSARDVDRQFVPIGPARRVRAGRDVTLVGWGNTVRLCSQVAATLEQVGVEAEVLDLRSLSPWDERTVLASAEKTAHLIVTHEDNHTCGLGAEIVATVAEKARVPVATRRVTRPDTHIPCNFANQVEILPSFKRLLTAAAELMDLELSWIAPPAEEAGVTMVEAVGSSPSDESVIVADLYVRAGDTVHRGDAIASLEATKSVFELTSTASGVVEEIFVEEGETVAVGQPLIRIRSAEKGQKRKPLLQERPGTPVLRRRPQRGRLILPRRDGEPRRFDVGLSSIASVEGSRVVGNAELIPSRSGFGPDDILRRTGIHERHWVQPGEDAVSLAVHACRNLLDRENMILDDLDMLVCSTTSPLSVTPSMACRVLNRLAGGKGELMLQAFDINAACSGYLYALQAGYDYLQSAPHGRVLIVTTEVLSPLLDREDFDTAILFGDAASATILYGEAHFDRARARLQRPELSAKGDAGGALSVPLLHDGFIQMQGRKVFSEAVRTMIASLSRVCQGQGLGVEQLNLIVPHQANQRIIDAIQNRVSPRVFSNIRCHGNTSSTSIPLCLDDILPGAQPGDRLGLCAFGGGFTFGASILEVN
jgi:2-oxoisovalerate dehydrogenase E1 component